MPLWQSHPIRLKYPGLERLSPESFSKGASHRLLNPPHFMVPIFNSSERDSGGREWRKQLQIRVASPHTIEVLDAISAGLRGSLSYPSDRHRDKRASKKELSLVASFTLNQPHHPLCSLPLHPKRKLLQEKRKAIPFCQTGGLVPPRYS